MSNHYIAVNRGTGLKPADITAGTSSASTKDVELRIADGASLTKLDVNNAIEQIKTFFNSRQNATFPNL
jgi:hypothetical protein